MELPLCFRWMLHLSLQHGRRLGESHRHFADFAERRRHDRRPLDDTEPFALLPLGRSFSEAHSCRKPLRRRGLTGHPVTRALLAVFRGSGVGLGRECTGLLESA